MGIGSIFAVILAWKFYVKERKDKRAEQKEKLIHTLFGFSRQIYQLRKRLSSEDYDKCIDDFKKLKTDIKYNATPFYGFLSEKYYEAFFELANSLVIDNKHQELENNEILERLPKMDSEVYHLLFRLED